MVDWNNNIIYDYTGSGRYVPGGNAQTSNAQMLDPYTDSGRYVAQTNGNVYAKECIGKYFVQ